MAQLQTTKRKNSGNLPGKAGKSCFLSLFDINTPSGSLYSDIKLLANLKRKYSRTGLHSSEGRSRATATNVVGRHYVSPELYLPNSLDNNAFFFCFSKPHSSSCLCRTALSMFGPNLPQAKPAPFGLLRKSAIRKLSGS